MLLSLEKSSRQARWWTSAYMALAVAFGVVACGGGGDSPGASGTAVGTSLSSADPNEVATAVAAAEEVKIAEELDAPASMAMEENRKVCKDRNNNTFQKLLTCVTLDGVRTHQLKLRDIALANGGTRDEYFFVLGQWQCDCSSQHAAHCYGLHYS